MCRQLFFWFGTKWDFIWFQNKRKIVKRKNSNNIQRHFSLYEIFEFTGHENVQLNAQKKRLIACDFHALYMTCYSKSAEPDNPRNS